MADNSEILLGSTKYDGKIRRITLLKRVADALEMRDGDEIEYYQIGDEIVIRKKIPFDTNLPTLFKKIPEKTFNAILDFLTYFGTDDPENPKNMDEVSQEDMIIAFEETIKDMSKEEVIEFNNALNEVIHEINSTLRNADEYQKGKKNGK